MGEVGEPREPRESGGSGNLDETSGAGGPAGGERSGTGGEPSPPPVDPMEAAQQRALEEAARRRAEQAEQQQLLARLEAAGGGPDDAAGGEQATGFKQSVQDIHTKADEDFDTVAPDENSVREFLSVKVEQLRAAIRHSNELAQPAAISLLRSAQRATDLLGPEVSGAVATALLSAGLLAIKLPPKVAVPLASAAGRIVEGMVGGRQSDRSVLFALREEFAELMRQGYDGGGVVSRIIEAINAAEAGGLLPERTSPERGEAEHRRGDLFTQRVEVAPDAILKAIDKEGGEEAVLEELRKKHGEEIFVEVIRGRTVYFFEFNILDRQKCLQHRDYMRSVHRESAVVELVAEGRYAEGPSGGDFTREELEALRTFERKGIVFEDELESYFEDYFFDPDEAPDPARLQARYDTYKNHLSHLTHSLNALVAGKEADDEDPIFKAAVLVQRGVEAIQRRAAGIGGSLRLRVPDTIREEAAQYGEHGQQEQTWLVLESQSMEDAIKKEIIPLVQAIEKVVVAAKTGRETVHNPSKSIADVIAAGKGVRSVETARVFENYPDLERAMRAYALCQQRAVAEVDRIFIGDFGMLHQGIEDAERDARVILKLERLARKRAEAGPDAEPDSVTLSARDEAEIKYLVELASGIHKVTPEGQYWSFLLAACDGEIGLETQKGGTVRRTFTPPSSPVLMKLLEMVSAEAALYDASSGTAAKLITGIPINRSPGKNKEHASNMKLTVESYQWIVEALLEARRHQPATATGTVESGVVNRRKHVIGMLQHNKLLHHVVAKVPCNVLGAGAKKIPALALEVQSRTARAESDVRRATDVPLTDREKWIIHDRVVRSLFADLGPQAAVSYLLDNVEKMAALDPTFAEEFARATVIKAGQEEEKKGFIFHHDHRQEEAVVNLEQARTRALAKYLTRYVYSPLIDSDPSMAVLLQHRLLEPDATTIRQDMHRWVTGWMSGYGAMPSMPSTASVLRMCELYSMWRRKEGARGDIGGVVDMSGPQLDVLRSVSGMPADVDNDRLRYLLVSYNETLARRISNPPEGGGVDLAIGFGYHHALGLGSFDTQLSSYVPHFGAWANLQPVTDPLGDLQTVIDLKTLRKELAEPKGALAEIKITPDEFGSGQPLGAVAGKIREIVAKKTKNEAEQKRIAADLIIFCIMALLPAGDENVYKTEGIEYIGNSRRLTLRYLIAKELSEALGIPDEIVTEGEGGRVDMNTITFQSICREIDVDPRVEGNADRFVKFAKLRPGKK